MSGDTKRNLLAHWIPITSVGFIISAAFAAGVWGATLSSSVTANAQEITSLKTADFPTRNEFNALQKDITEIKSSVKDINNYILRAK